VASEEVMVPASRTKTLMLVIIAVGFVALGFWLLSLDPKEVEAQDRYNNPIVIYGLGCATVVFFGLLIVAGVWRLFSTKPGLVLNSEGVKIFAIGQDTFLAWRDISGFSIFQVQRTKLLVLNLNDPVKYIESLGKVRRALAQANLKLCGSPIAVSSGTVAVSFGELRELFAKYIGRYGSAA
jgi:hypothetical protein